MSEEKENCLHHWWDLDFLENEEGLACSECGKIWLLQNQDESINEEVIPDLIQTIWQSSKHAISELRLRIQELEQIVSKKLSLFPCTICEKWSEHESMKKFGSEYVCFEDMGNYVEETNIEEEELSDEIVDWFNELQKEACISSNFILVEKNVSCSPILASLLSEEYERSNHGLKENEKKLLSQAGIEEAESLVMLSKFFQLDTPLSRTGEAYLNTLFNYSNKIDGDEDICDYIVPSDQEVRSRITVDLAAQGMASGREFSIPMADSLLEALNHRCFELVKEKFRLES